MFYTLKKKIPYGCLYGCKKLIWQIFWDEYYSYPFFLPLDYFGHKLGVRCKSTIILMELSSPHLCGIHQNLISPVSFGNLYSLVGTLSPCRVWTSRIDMKYCFFNDLMVIVFFNQNGPTLSFLSKWATIFSSITRYDSSFSTLSFICHKLG